jgi:radical SAM protein with 4Fe4S-binding SPASM domain
VWSLQVIETHGIEVDLQITNQCPLRCKHCVYDSSMANGDGLPRDLVERLCGEFEELGVTQVSITGGEPFLRADLTEVIAALSARRFEVCVQTAGLFVKKIDFEALRASGLSTLLVSIDGPPGYHDEFRRRPGTFADARKTVALAKKHSIPVRINTVVTCSNAGFAADLLPMAEDDGVDVYSFFYFSPLGRGAACSEEALSFSEWRRFAQKISEWRAEHNLSRMTIKLQAVAGATETLPPSGQRCRIKDRDNILIMANGDVYPCVFVCHCQNLCLGNVFEHPLTEIWRASETWTSGYEPFFVNGGRDCAGAVRNCSGGCPALREILRRPGGCCDRRCEWDTTGLAPGCAREYERLC